MEQKRETSIKVKAKIVNIHDLQKTVEKTFIFLTFLKNNYKSFLLLEFVTTDIQLMLIVSNLNFASFYALPCA